jgi:hypothetical protein
MENAGIVNRLFRHCWLIPFAFTPLSGHCKQLITGENTLCIYRNLMPCAAFMRVGRANKNDY